MTPAAAPEQIRAALDRAIAPWAQADRPGMVAAVSSVHDGWTWRGAAGSADVQSGAPNTIAGRFRIGSITKQFLCAVVFDLAEQGRIELEASARRYLPQLASAFEPVTILRLTDHTSGIWCHLTTSSLVNGRGLYPPPADEEIIDQVCSQRAPAFAPGARLSYSNGGSALLSRIVELVEDAPLERVFETRLFGPIGMSRSSLLRRDSDFEPGLVALHMIKPDGGFARGYMPYPMAGEGGGVSTLDDMLAWLAHLDAPHAFTAKVVEQMHAPVILANGFTANFRRGIIHARHRGVDVLYHDGGVIGGLARAARIPVLGLHVVLLANRGDVSLNAVTRGLIDAAAGDQLTEPAPAAPSQAWDGAFHRPGGTRVYRFTEPAGAAMVDIAGLPAPLVMAPDGHLRADSTETADLRFLLSEDGHTLTVEDRGEIEICTRLSGHAANADDRAAVAGAYANRDLDAEATIREDQVGLTLEIRGPRGLRRYSLASEAPDLWQAVSIDPPPNRPLSPALAVSRRDGRITGFRLTLFRAELQFERRAS